MCVIIILRLATVISDHQFANFRETNQVKSSALDRFDHLQLKVV